MGKQANGQPKRKKPLIKMPNGKAEVEAFATGERVTDETVAVKQAPVVVAIDRDGNVALNASLQVSYRWQ